MIPFLVLLGVVAIIAVLFSLGIKSVFYNCAPNEVLILSGGSRNMGTRTVRYRLIKGGFAIRIPLLERVDRLDLTNMIIELTATGAYSKGGIPLNVNGVANVKIAGHEPVMNNAIERFLGKSRPEIIGIAKATLEGSLRGVLATLTPEQVNQDRTAFAEKLVQEVEADMTTLGLVVDTLKIQNVSDDVHYLDSIGRIRNAELNATARTAEAIAKADSVVAAAANSEAEVKAQVDAQASIIRAEGERMLMDTLSKRDAVVAEEQAAVVALVAKAKADVEVQKARIEQIRNQLDAEVIQPAKAKCEAAEAKATAQVANIIEEGKARADAFRKLAESWQQAGDQAREILILQKLDVILKQLTLPNIERRIDKVTVVDSASSNGPLDARQLVSANEQIKNLFGVDVADKLRKWPAAGRSTEVVIRPQTASETSLQPPPIPSTEQAEG